MDASAVAVPAHVARSYVGTGENSSIDTLIRANRLISTLVRFLCIGQLGKPEAEALETLIKYRETHYDSILTT